MTLRVVADLRVEVDGVQAHVTGDGDQVRVVSRHPLRLLRGAVRSPGVSGLVRRVPGRLAAEGVTVTVAGRRTDLMRLGAHAGRLHVRPAGSGWWAALAVTVVAVAIARGRRQPLCAS